MLKEEMQRQGYTVDAHGIIRNPGKFEGEPSFVLHFWNAFLIGGADEDDGEICTFHVSADDVREFPVLATAKDVEIWEDGNGFVHHRVLAK